jgi:hypothetical protein
MRIEVEGLVAEARFAAVVTEVKVALPRDRPRRLFASFAAKERNMSGPPGKQ